jgi:hypothetical protein
MRRPRRRHGRSRSYPMRNGTKDQSKSLESTPVLVYSWAGGLLDVYACGLSMCHSTRLPPPAHLQKETPNEALKTSPDVIELSDSSSSVPSMEQPKEDGMESDQKVLLTVQELLENGSVQLLWDLLQCMESSPSEEIDENATTQLQQSDWNKALDEYRNFVQDNSSSETSPITVPLPTCDQIMSGSFLEIRKLLLCLASISPSASQLSGVA